MYGASPKFPHPKIADLSCQTAGSLLSWRCCLHDTGFQSRGVAEIGEDLEVRRETKTCQKGATFFRSGFRDEHDEHDEENSVFFLELKFKWNDIGQFWVKVRDNPILSWHTDSRHQAIDGTWNLWGGDVLVCFLVILGFGPKPPKPRFEYPVSDKHRIRYSWK